MLRCRDCRICKRCQQGRKLNCGTCSVCKNCGDERVRLWRFIHSPFNLPQGRVGHSCEWQCFDVDMAGCRECGAIHRCDDGGCPVSEENDSHVCLVTGNCVKLKCFSKVEFMDNIIFDDIQDGVGSEKSVFADYYEIKNKVSWILSSELAKSSFLQERGRMEQKHRHLMWKILRDIKIAGGIPNMCGVMTKILHATNKIRVCSSVFQVELRCHIIGICTEAISKFVNMLSQKFRDVLSSIKRHVLIVGILYLMRMGISMHNIILLPRVPQLQLLLPIEAHLKSFFKIKCKSITEVENMVKMCIRGLSVVDLERMGFTMMERVL